MLSSETVKRHIIPSESSHIILSESSSSLPNHHHPFRIIIIPSKSSSSLPNHRTSSLPNHYHPFRIMSVCRNIATRSALLNGHVFVAYKIRNLSCCRSSAIMKKTISVASKMNHVCYEHFLIRPAYETAPTDQ